MLHSKDKLWAYHSSFLYPDISQSCLILNVRSCKTFISLNLTIVLGSDASESFEDVGHSTDARDIMQQYYVGELAEVQYTPE